MEVITGNAMVVRSTNSPSMSPILTSFKSNRRSAMELEICGNSTPSGTYNNVFEGRKEEKQQQHQQQHQQQWEQQQKQKQQQQQQQQQQQPQANSEKEAGNNKQKYQHQRPTSSFSSAVEIYQNKLNYKNNKSLPAAESDASVSEALSDQPTSANPRVNILRTEIASLREEMLLKIDALENDMSHQMDMGFKFSHKSTQTDEVPILPKHQQSLESRISQDHETDDHCHVPSSNFSFLLNTIMTQMDRKLEDMKNDILQRLKQQNLTLGKSMKPAEKSSIHNNGHVTSTSILTQDLSLMNVPVTLPTAPGIIQRECERIDSNLNQVTNYTRGSNSNLHQVNNYTRNSHNGRNSRFHHDGTPLTTTTTTMTAAAVVTEYVPYQPECTSSVTRANPEIKPIFVPYGSESPVLYPYSSSRNHKNHSPIGSSNDKSLHEPSATYVNFDQYSQTAREELARHLVDQLFLYDDLADANVRGVKGKRLLDPSKIQQIRESVFRTYPVRNSENEDYLWKFICDKINAKCRGVTRTLKRKTNDFGYRFNDYQLTNHSSMSLSDYHKYQKDRYEYERCSFVTADSSASLSQRRLRSSSESETSSVEMGSNSQLSDFRTRYSNDHDNNATEELVRESHWTPFSAAVSLSNEYKTTHDPNDHLMLKREEDTDVKVTDDGDDISDDGESLDPARDLEVDRENDPHNEIEASLDICDKLAEKYTDHYPNIQGQDSITDRKRTQGNREEFTRTLIEAMFTRSTLAHSNVTGARGKFMLDPIKIAKVRETVFKKFPAENEDEEEVLWKVLTTKINTKCRGVKRLMKRKGIPAECITKRYQTIDDGANKHKVVVVKNESTPYPAIYDEDIHSELTRYSTKHMN